MLTSVRNPAGWVTKAAEQEEKARRGEEWRSEAYVVFCLFSFFFWTDAGAVDLRLSVGRVRVSQPECAPESFLARMIRICGETYV